MLARKHDVKALAESSTVTKAEAKAERQRAIKSVNIPKSVFASPALSSSSSVSARKTSSSNQTASSPSRAPKPLLPPPLAVSVSPSAADSASVRHNDAQPLLSARLLRHSIDDVMSASAAADSLALADNDELDSADPAKLASALFSGVDVVPQRPQALPTKGGHGRSPRFDIVS
jgi:hypothetical protein